jgi:hypothetical protein
VRCNATIDRSTRLQIRIENAAGRRLFVGRWQSQHKLSLVANHRRPTLRALHPTLFHKTKSAINVRREILLLDANTWPCNASTIAQFNSPKCIQNSHEKLNGRDCTTFLILFPDRSAMHPKSWKLPTAKL